MKALLPYAKLVGLATLVILACQVLRWGWPDTLEADLASWGLYLLMGAAWLRGDRALDRVESARKTSEAVAQHMLSERDKLEGRHRQACASLVTRLGECGRERARQAGVIEQQRKDLALLTVRPEEVLEAMDSVGVPHYKAFVTAWQHSDKELRAVLSETSSYRGMEAQLLARKLSIYRGNK